MNPYGWIGAALVLLSMWIVGNGNRVGFLVGAVAEGFWLIYAFSIGSVELAIMSVVFVGVYIRNWMLWKRNVGSGEKASRPISHT